MALVGGIHQTVDARQITVACTEEASDENEGTAESPFRTIGFAVSTAQPGDTVNVLSGDYRDEDNGFGVGVIPINKSGTEAEPIQIQAGKGQRVLVTQLFVFDSSYLALKNFRVEGFDFDTIDGWKTMPTIVRATEGGLPDVDFTEPFENREDLIRAEFATYFSLIDQLDFSIGVDVKNSDNVEISYNRVVGYFAGVQCRGCSQIDVVGNTIRECVNGVFTFYPDDQTTAGLTDSSIRYNNIQQSLDNGIDIRADSQSVRIENNYVAFSGRAHISLQGGASSCLVRANYVRRGGFYSETMVYPGSSAISLNDAGDNNAVQSNFASLQIDLTGVDGNGIIIDILRPGATATVRRNICVDNAGSGLNLTLSPGTVITTNMFAFNGRHSNDERRGAGIKISRDSDIGNSIFGNLLFLNNAAGILSSGNVELQQRIDRNFYITAGEPLIWDGFSVGDRDYPTLSEVRENTPWETRGNAIVW